MDEDLFDQEGLEELPDDTMVTYLQEESLDDLVAEMESFLTEHTVYSVQYGVETRAEGVRWDDDRSYDIKTDKSEVSFENTHNAVILYAED